MKQLFRLSLAFTVGIVAGLMCLACTTQALDRDYAVSVAGAKDVCAVVEKLPDTLAQAAASVGAAKLAPATVIVAPAPVAAPSAPPAASGATLGGSASVSPTKAPVTAPATPAPAASGAVSK